MRFSLLVVGWLLVCFNSIEALAGEKPESVVAERSVPQIVVTSELVAAHRAVVEAKLRWQQYRFATLPQQRRQLDATVRSSEAEIQILHRRLKDYRPFLQTGRYSPVRTAAESYRLTLLASEQKLAQLKEQRIALMRYSRQNSQLYQLDILQATARLTAIRSLSQTNGSDVAKH